MDLIFPRDMINGHKWKDVTFNLVERQEVSRQASGRTQSRDLGPAIWVAQFKTISMRLFEARSVMASMRTLCGSNRSFFAFDPAARFPMGLTSAATLNGAAPQVHGIGTENSTIRISGLPEGTPASPGDYISIVIAGGGRDFHQIASAGVAGADGITPELAVVPHLRPQVLTGQAVALVDPCIEAVLVPGSLDDPLTSKQRRAVTFSAVQVLR
ncbi:hypothetical protein [Pelagimonas varians]|uniref:Uncharacterized protein n=1 Tax=Pelagimonas varians TaxID=696760 RepID=A0A238JZ18_9RHOB|nr:hypothetical protein [Pelagimonas varians]PYG33125.1 hypothetical protein C8N36_102120 [Pelagimonas varians]SMX35753.1 hypothetical protein PEV8663_00582 [Pelagimonas varians]